MLRGLALSACMLFFVGCDGGAASGVVPRPDDPQFLAPSPPIYLRADDMFLRQPLIEPSKKRLGRVRPWNPPDQRLLVLWQSFGGGAGSGERTQR